MNQSTYTTEQVQAEKLIGELYGMAKGKATNKTQLAAIEIVHSDLLQVLYHDWNSVEAEIENLKEEVNKLLQTNAYRQGAKK